MGTGEVTVMMGLFGKTLVIAALLALSLATVASAKDVTVDLKIGDGSQWSFPAGKWTQNEEDKPPTTENMHLPPFSEKGVIVPPDQKNLHSRAFFKGQAFGDMVIEFDYNGNYRENGAGDAGVIFRASDTNHFYYVHLPWGVQQMRAKHYWAAIAKVEGDGYIRNMQMANVPGLPSEINRWYHVKIEAVGPRIRVWVDGRRALDVTDSTYKSGFVGLAGYGMYYFRNVHVTGSAAKSPKWNDKETIPSHAFTIPGLDCKEMPTACIAPNGDVLLAVGTKITRSSDKGRTWSAPVDLSTPGLSLGDYGATMFCTKAGRLIVMAMNAPPAGGKAGVTIRESKDNGLTWSEPVASEVEDGWPVGAMSSGVYGPLVETEDGTLLRFMYGSPDPNNLFTNSYTWGALRRKAYTIRSTDGGKSWSKPIEIDQPSGQGNPRGSMSGSLDLTEPTGVAIGNKVTVLVRPIFSRQMWQCWSNDAGATWDSAARTTFPGYAQAMIRTKSGAILCGHRYPGYSINVSHDDGLNWDEGTLIDNANWAMGTMTEVEPNVVLATYMNAYRDQPLLLQLVRVKKNRIEPVK